MPSIRSKTLLAALAGAAAVSAHGHVTNLVIDGVYYENYDPTSFKYLPNPPLVPGWKAGDSDNGFIAPSSYGGPDIICHKDATNADAHVVVAAGDKVAIQWTAWPSSHKGPVIDYLASCGDSCETVDKTTLEFVKIDGVGLVDAGSNTWGTDQLIANNNSWLVEIPPTIAPGNYVLRHEIIALHSANNADGAQNYPQCFNIQVTGSGAEKPKGTLGEKLYGEKDPGILINIYQTLSSYVMPGPAQWTGAVSISQATSQVTATSTAIKGSGTAAPAATTAAAGSSAAPTSAAAGSSAAPSPAVTSASASRVSATPVGPTNPAATKTAAATSTGSGCGAKHRRVIRHHPRDLANL